MTKTIDNTVFSEKEIFDKAEHLSKLPLNKQTSAIEKIYTRSPIDAVRIAIGVIEIVKKSMDDTNKNNKQFMSLCEKGIDTLNRFIADGKLSEKEKTNSEDIILKILTMASDTNHETNKSNDKKFWGVLGVTGSLSALLIIAKTVFNRK